MWCGGGAGSVSVSPPAASLEDSCSVYERYMRSFHPPSAARAPAPPHTSHSTHAPPRPEEEECSGELTSLARAPLDPDSPDNTSSVPPEEADTTRSDRSGEAPAPPPLGTLVSMENSNNAVDGGRLFHSAPVFKLPGAELTFNGTLKHLQKLKPIVDPTAAVGYDCFGADAEPSCNVYNEEAPNDLEVNEDYADDEFPSTEAVKSTMFLNIDYETNGSDVRLGPESESSREVEDRLVIDEKTYSTCSSKDIKSSGLNRSGESLDTSYNSGVRSPDLFSDEDEDSQLPHIRLLEFLDKHETYDKIMVKKMEKTLSGVLPPPSITTFNLDTHEMLNKYYSHLPYFTNEPKTAQEPITTDTPKKCASFVRVACEAVLPDASEETIQDKRDLKNVTFGFHSSNGYNEADYRVQNALNTSDMIGPLPEMGSEEIAKEAPWPEILKCRYYDVHYNLSSYSERVEYLAMRCAQRYVDDEMASSVTVFSSGPQSPSSAQKRKALRVKMAQAKSPGRRLSHLARRRQAFCSAANIAEKTQGTSKMVLIDKNFFPHRKLTHTNDRKSPRTRRTPGRKTPGKKTPGKKTPGKKPAGTSSKKKAMRRLVLDSESATRSQPTRETSRRALFQSPENAKNKKIDVPKSTNARAIKSKRALFGSPETDSRSLEGTPTDGSGKRKREMLDGSLDSGGKCKMQKSLSFGGEPAMTEAHTSLERRATEVFANRNGAQLNDLHKKKLLWAVSEALRAHGWRLGSPGFKDKASSLARLTRRLMILPPHAARLSTPQTSTSDYMLRLARQYVFSIIQGRPVEECYTEEQIKLANESSTKLTGYVSVSAYQQHKAKPSTLTSATLIQTTVQSSKIKENTCDSILFKSEQPRSATKNILQDKLVNIDSSSSNSIFSVSDDMTLFKSNSMPPFKESPRKGVRRQISFDNVDVAEKR